MNILIPDSWLRVYLDTKAAPVDIQRSLSLCGPSVERIEKIGSDYIYDIEVTTNRVDSFSIYGIAREAAAILPEFGIPAKLTDVRYKPADTGNKSLDIKILDENKLCRRILAVKLENITLGPSPQWLAKRLESVGQRPLNNIIDITNYVMWELGHPLHAFDYDRLTNKSIIVRLAKKGERLTTLDGKTYKMVGGEVIFDNGKGTIIDLPGIMGTANTVVTDKTKNVLLFIENSDPTKIRFASMTHAIRTQAAVINEKNPDPQVAIIALKRALHLAKEIVQPKSAGKISDIYPDPIKPKVVTISQNQFDKYLGCKISGDKVDKILSALGFSVKFVKEPSPHYLVTPPSWRVSDIAIPEDIIEEVARIYGYHNIKSVLPETAPPTAFDDPLIHWEEEIKIRLRDWGFTEIYTYSMISKELMDIFQLDKTNVYKISNPLSKEWVYMRPTLWPSMLNTVKENLNYTPELKLFELSMIYEFRSDNLPIEKPILLVAVTGKKFLEVKGLAESIFEIFGIDFPQSDSKQYLDWYSPICLSLGKYGSLGMVNPQLLNQFGIKQPVTILELEFDLLVKEAKPRKAYQPIPKYPPVIEDLTFILQPHTPVGEILQEIKTVSPQISKAELIGYFENSVTFRIYYLDKEVQITADQVAQLRKKIIAVVSQKFSAKLKGSY